MAGIWMAKDGRRSVALGLAMMVLGVLPAATGCGAFFQCEGKSDCKTTTTTTVAGDFAYMTTAADTVAQFNISSGTFVSLGTALSLGYQPVAISVAPSNSFVYIAAASGIYLYSVGTTGALTAANSGSALVADTISTMDISPDGNYLFTVNITGATITEYTINTSTGALAAAGTFGLPTPSSGASTCVMSTATTLPYIQQCAIKVSPNKNFVVVSAGPGGVVTFPYTSSSGITSATYSSFIQSTENYFSAAVDTNNIVYAGLTSEVDSHVASSTTGALTTANISTVTDNNAPRSVIVDGTSYVYWADVSASQIEAYSTSSGTLSTAAIGTYATATNVSALAIDNTGKYLVAVGFNASTGAQIFSIGSTGALTTLSSAATTAAPTTYPALVALSH